jgi:hypothetical protein
LKHTLLFACQSRASGFPVRQEIGSRSIFTTLHPSGTAEQYLGQSTIKLPGVGSVDRTIRLTYGFSVTQDQLKTCPQTQREIIDSYFMEHRAKLIDIAAYLDRVDRGQTSEPDFRHAAFQQALKILLSEQPHRTRRVLELFSVTDSSIPQSAHGLKGASGAVPLEKERE